MTGRPPAAGDDPGPSGRAAAAERAVTARHVRRLWGLPGTALGVVSWPPVPNHALFGRWHYWWQAHLLDCLVDAELRAPDATRRRRIRAQARTPFLRNGFRWRNRYYDDMSWLALALLRADATVGSGHRRAVDRLTTEMLDAWSDEEGGGIPWRRRDAFKNAPANGPAAILLARTGHVERAAAMVDWMDGLLRHPETDLVRDGVLHGEVNPDIWTYNQGTVLGAELELVRRTGRDPRGIHRLVAAVDRRLTVGGVLIGHGGADPGLFTGILARYLAQIALHLPGTTAADADARATAARLLVDSADAAWAHRVESTGGPLFGADWTTPAPLPGARREKDPGLPEHDLAVQLSAWMLLEAAAAVTGRAGGTASA
ncbi:fructose-bisphosphate aldolase [Nakamurella flavida]|uniref:Fructose-bisphosphate aldolase n=1 Tax=Nakamurella flavida TaxID=363630 RepID=A0A938YJ09_9ACTN|nr:glycoside hydrolase family 76 protein [Nakamurella flavida]MBM9476019.1 fructose-bisphosphate aldolase [Nakamurella flavida]MDP9777238.1 putative alpha-1,6-mannanase (GH76 family) [Nakamurella flavida]